MSKTIPNSLILINTLALREAKDSSEIENIITTNDELYKADIEIEITDSSTKEVQNYTRALK
ncbi:MAG: Fic/DOC family N-terminal domain-containing protein, partial [Fusobacteriaceae bacterium]